ncbi:MAG: hypothetical protein AB8G26_01700 [Ilumatobacter sp.]
MTTADRSSTSVEHLWRELVTAALLGSDRREPPTAAGPVGDLVADSVDGDPSTRMLTTVAACVAVRRAAVRPAAVIDGLQPPDHDDRPSCPPAAVERWRHVVASWPVLEDEWMLTCIEQGWRVAPEIVPAMLHRHRRDAVRLTRATVAAGPIAAWLADHVDELDVARATARLTPVEAESLGELPALPIPPEFSRLLEATGAEVGGVIGVGVERGDFAEAHRAVLVNVLARCVPGGLRDVADVLTAVDTRAPGRGLASLLADLALTRARMLDELAAPLS